MNVQDIEIKSIKQIENIRLRIEEKDVHTLMSSIKQDGLLEPIGLSYLPGKKDEYYVVYGNRRLEACKKLGWSHIPSIIMPQQELKEFFIKNTLENLERQDLSEAEMGRLFYTFRNDYKMSGSEIASRFGFNKRRIQTAISIFQRIPEDQRNDIKYIGPGGQKKGKIPASAVDKVLGIRHRYNLTEQNMRDLLNETRQDDFSVRHLELIACALKNGSNIEEAKQIAKEYQIVALHIPIKKIEIKKLKQKHKKSFINIIQDILRGNLKEEIDIPKWRNWS